MQKSAGKRTPCAVPSLSRKPAQCQFQFQCQCQSNTSLTLLSQLLSGPPAAGHVLKLKPPSSLCLRAEFFCPPSFRSLSPRTSSDCPSLLIFYTLLCPVPDLALNTYIQYIYIQYIYTTAPALSDKEPLQPHDCALCPCALAKLSAASRFFTAGAKSEAGAVVWEELHNQASKKR